MTTAHPKVRIQYLRNSQAVYTANGAGGLRYATSGSVGLDLRACLEEDEASIPAGGRLAIPSGIAVEPLTPGIAGFVYSRSGLGAMQGLTVAQRFRGLRTYGKTLGGLHRARRRTYMSIPAAAGQEIPS